MKGRLVHAEDLLRQEKGWTLLIALSFVPLLVKAGSYVMIGSYVPLLVFCFFGALVGWGMRNGAKAERRALRAWAVAIILWGLARFGVMGLFLFTSVAEAHIESQLTARYVLVSLGHLMLGVYLVRHSRRAA